MVAFRRILVAALATVLFAGACTSINIPTIPPINLPSIPPINLPSIPPINVPGFTIPPIVIPGFSIAPGQAQCTLVTAAEVGQIFGTQVSDQSDQATDCSFLITMTSVVTVQATSDTDMSTPQLLLGSSAQQSTIGGFPALTGVFIGQPAVYVQKPSGQLQVLGILTGTDPATITKLQQVATIAVGRMP